ncbi:putative sugar kinase [Diplonema papillatum]|nr:putative sugar kinase [Diplonema papillatum]KAJ9469155.1 putative sugar kinase [Diplonema papillatum]KAJ9469156.1 putative sugar kinase [Diplonema papillatum]
MSLVLAVDVGSASVRAGMLDAETGEILAECVEDIRQHRPLRDHVEQSTRDIWQQVCAAARSVVDRLPASVTDHKKLSAIAFDSTCSLTVVPKEGCSAPVGDDSAPEWDIIMWMDHRATGEAAEINAAPEAQNTLEYVGGKVSPEMELAKVKWLFKNKPPAWWDRVDKIFDLPDYLSWRCVGSPREDEKVSRSMCSLVCKCGYVNDPPKHGAPAWDAALLRCLFAPDAAAPSLPSVARILEIFGGSSEPTGGRIQKLGVSCGVAPKDVLASFGCGAIAADTVHVGSSLIDAHAGGVSLCDEREAKVAIIAGTSGCFMGQHPQKVPLAGVWGPYKDAMVPGMWVNEGGLSAMGTAITRALALHPLSEQTGATAAGLGQSLVEYLDGRRPAHEAAVERLVRKNISVYPDFLGNRSPLADPSLTGMVCGLTLDDTEDSLLDLYAAGVFAVSYGVKHVIDAFVAGGYDKLTALSICGGMSSNTLFTESLAAVTGLAVHTLDPSESAGGPMLKGAAVSGAMAASLFPSFDAALKTFTPRTHVAPPPSPRLKDLHARRYAVHLEMLSDQLKYRKMLQED